jgi:hypothetical protein
MTQQAIAAQVGARIRAYMATKDWNWRFSDPDAADDIGRMALTRLQDERARACHWLQLAAEAIGMPLPVGNGTNGPWNRTAVLDATNRFGLLDIARGAIVWTNVAAPIYVRRFAVRSNRGSSPHMAGGTGGMGSAVTQIALTYGMRGVPSPKIVVPHPTVILIEYGLQTCYGDVGRGPGQEYEQDTWRKFDPTLWVETDTPQWERAVWGVGIELAASYYNFRGTIDVSATARSSKAVLRNWGPAVMVKHDVRLRPSCMGGECDIEVFGVGNARREHMQREQDAFRVWAQCLAAQRAAEAARDVLVGARIEIDRLRNSCESHRHPREWNCSRPEVQRRIVATLLCPED